MPSPTMASRVAAIAALFCAGLALRMVDPPRLSATVFQLWPATTTVTLYFGEGGRLFPLSRPMTAGPDLPRQAIESLLAGPPPSSALERVVPHGLTLRQIAVTDGVVRVDLGGDVGTLRNNPEATTAIVATLTRLPGIRAAEISADGAPLTRQPERRPLAYYASARGLVAVPFASADARTGVQAYLARDPGAEITRLPPDVRLLDYGFDPREGLVSLRFAYTPSLRTLAIERPAAMRSALLALIATMTEFPDVRAVYLDFGGQSRLGLGQCSDLIRVPQPRPSLLNDERLL